MPEFASSSIPSSLVGSIEILKNLHDISQYDAIDAAESFVAAVALMTELKRDQATLYRISINEACFPQDDEIPAISTVIKDPLLLQSLIRSLLTATGGNSEFQDTGSTSGSLGSNGHNPQYQNMIASNGRKRPLPTVSDPLSDRANKALKSSHSPVPHPRLKLSQVQDISRKKPLFNPQIPAATILFAAFRQLDHWPEQFVRAYAEDSFGPRLWVDDERCALFVANLALTHSEKSRNVATDLQKELEASVVAKFYRQFNLTGASLSSGCQTSSPAKRRGSLDSSSSRERPRSSQIDKQMSTTSEDSDIVLLGNIKSDIDQPLSTHKNRTSDEVYSENRDRIITKVHSVEEQKQDSLSINVMKNASIDSNAADRLNTTDNALGYPIRQRVLTFASTRQRYFGANLQLAHESIALSLLGRLEQKSRQNSGLLQSLPLFAPVPGVRVLIAQNLEQWLKSPALAGLARSLFTATVNNMENTDPPLAEDLMAIDCILGMKLKVNQFNAHIDNITAIARRIPAASIAHHMYCYLFRELLSLSHTDGISSSSELKMISAIHKEINPLFSYDALAAVILTELVNLEGEKSDTSQPVEDREIIVKKLKHVIRALSSELGHNFDGCQLIAALLSLDVNTESWSIRGEQDKARLMLQSAMLCTDLVMKGSDGSLTASSKISLRKSLNKARKLLLTWCCSDYGSLYRSPPTQVNNIEDDDSKVGAGVPVFNSILGPTDEEEKLPSWLCTMRCLLFLEDTSSPLMKRFLAPDGDEAEWNEDMDRVSLCCKFGGDVTDDLIWIILKSASLSEGGIDSSMAILLLENLVENCSRHKNGSLHVSDPMIAWELYNLVLYQPTTHTSISDEPYGIPDTCPPGCDKKSDKSLDLPRLAYPGLWWRVTMIALILCGASPRMIGSVVWSDHPTLRALMKMITSNRYRFPTVDCDEIGKTKMKEDEQTARDKEAKVAECLFLPKVELKKEKDIKGSRVSRRLLKQQQEREAEKELAESNRRKKLLRIAQKSIMLWDPDGPARKPPRESVDLLFSVEDMFGLSDIFQSSVEPDFLLMTIGQTTRGAIERAYDWLIPIISTIPNTITRLPSSASCFLLLRAYGTEGDERKQLKELAAPLLRHVQESLNGIYGESDSVKAFDLLMSDVASAKPDRRRCARRVLQDALEQEESASPNLQTWMLNILNLQFAKALICDAVQYMSTAASFERGRVLRSILLALEQHFIFANHHSVKMDVSFPHLLMNLISIRPGACGEAMESFPDLWYMSTRIVYEEFLRLLKSTDECFHHSLEDDALIKLKKTGLSDERELILPLSLLRAICVCLSVWKNNALESEVNVTSAVQIMIEVLLEPVEENALNVFGLTGARLRHSDDAAISVESWILLAKARSDSVARRAALAAPAYFLPRLLLSSGLPRASLVTMIDRLGRLGDLDADKDQLYLDLLIPKAVSEWDIGRLGTRHDVALKLLGRLSAYVRLNQLSGIDENDRVSTTFIEWLSQACLNHQKLSAQKKKQRKSKALISSSFPTLATSSTLLTNLSEEKLTFSKREKLKKMDIEMNDFMQSRKHCVILDDQKTYEYLDNLHKSISANDHIEMDKIMNFVCHHLDQEILLQHDVPLFLSEMTLLCMETFMDFNKLPEGMSRSLLKWIPQISKINENPTFWKKLFGAVENTVVSWALDQLCINCVVLWSREMLSACTHWIIAQARSLSTELSFERMTTFLISTLQQPTCQLESVTGTEIQPYAGESSNDFVSCVTCIALHCLKMTKCESLEIDVCRRNSIPNGLTLILQLTQRGKVQLQMVTEQILKELFDTGLEPIFRIVFEIILLRMYLHHPYWMDLGSSVTRTALMHASEKHAASWVEWRSSLDDVVIDMVNAFFGGELRMSKSLSDFSRRHPLLMLRRLNNITAELELDATIKSWHFDDNVKGLVSGISHTGPCEAQIDEKVIKVTVKHWGYSFVEPLWATVLDIVSAIPREVLFTCGIKVGFLEFLGIYVQLMSVQLQLMSANKVSRLKGKLSECFAVFQQCNKVGWRHWLGMNVGDTEVRNLLLTCDFITPEEAMESLKSS